MAGEQVREETARELDRNEVCLVGRVSSEPESRELPSGDTLWLFRLVVRRPPGSSVRQSVDVLDVCAWSSRAQRSVKGWHEGDQVEIEGSVRRRFYRAAAATVSRCEIEMTGGRLRRRADGA